jgi:hypothetical protein
VTPWQLTDGGESYRSASRHAEAVAFWTDMLSRVPVSPGVPGCDCAVCAARTSLAAGTDKPESNPPHRITANPSVVDANPDAVYGDGVKRHPVESDVAPAFTGAGGVASSQGSPLAPGTTWSEAERQAWLRRVQAER